MSENSTSGGKLFASIAAAKPRLVTGVPDGMLAETIMLCEASPDFPYIACAREEECIGVACGAAMAGERAVVMVQNAGMLNSLGAFATMALRYGLPIVVIVTNRGALADPNGYDIEKREAFDAGVRPMAQAPLICSSSSAHLSSIAARRCCRSKTARAWARRPFAATR